MAQPRDDGMAPADDPRMPQTRRPRSAVAALLACLAAAAAVALWLLTESRVLVPEIGHDAPKPPAIQLVAQQTPSDSEEAHPSAVATQAHDETAAQDERYRTTILGTWWRDDYYGRTFLDLKAGGTGVMTIKFGSWYYYALGAKLDADITWKIENGRAIFDAVRGKPESAYKTVIGEKGSHRDRKIVEITDDRLVFKNDLDDQSVAVWRRVE